MLTPEEEQRLKRIENSLNLLMGLDRYTFQKNIQIFDGRNIQLGRTTGTKIGTATDQKIGFFGKVPVVQQTATNEATIITALKALGLIA